MSYLEELLDLLLSVLQAIFAFVADYARKHPGQTVLFALALLRLFGTTVQTGYKGVLFVFGRTRKELEPGFHPLLPAILAVRQIPVRSVTLELPRQRLTTSDDLVYDVQVNIVYRVADPVRALTFVDNLRHGIEAMLSLIAADLLRSQTRAAILDFKALETELSARAERSLQRWGVTVEQAGFQNIAPTKKTMHLTQLGMLTDERQRVLQELIAQGVSMNAAVALLGAERRLVSHSAARYRAFHRPVRLAPVAAETPHTLPLLPGNEPLAAQLQSQADQVPTLEILMAEPLPAPARPKQTTKGVQPRSWLRLRRFAHLGERGPDGPPVEASPRG
jgi:hypothetical protein